MIPEALIQLELAATAAHATVTSLYEQIPRTLRRQAVRANQLGRYNEAWPNPKPPSVTAYLAAHEQWEDLRRQIVEARPVDLRLAKVRRS